MRPEPLLRCREITVRFGGVTALADVALDVRPGSITSIIGPNGAGKTTLLGAITGMVRTASGSVALAGRDISARPAHARARAGIVRTFQNLEVFTNMTVVENVMTGCHRHVRYPALAALLRTPRYRREERRCLDHALDRLAFVGLGELADTPAAELAFGQQRALELARAVAANPSLLLLDEPAAGLNMAETRALGALIRRIRDDLGVTVVLVEHDMDLVMTISDEIMVLNHGCNLALGTPRQIQKNPEVVRAYLGDDDL
ncbi:ABC transporter ATP-binding protein [Desulfocurvus sp.]|jgi:branched-chain amino acid transport system ATP-binding protein|uniref:ABC transporter ATP-binding protein n=1 Tax=Desulfocurvus sp. TaxID=2871698 RepID=UPI0025BBBF4C|nr:ABC transporter ATP-binding protein [Desulfocurvus sp.]MCK9239887.1 ABC transporter ATP-binding protein [Desulfocurvus sp.]